MTHSQVPSQTQNGSKLLNNGIVRNASSSQHQKGQRGVLKLRNGSRKSDKLQLLTQTCIKPTNKLVSSLSGTPLVLKQAMGNPRLTRLTTARTQGKPPPSPIQYTLCLSAAPTFKQFFVPRLPRKSLETIPVWTPGTLQGHNYLLKPPIGMRSQENLYLSSKAFQRCIALHLHAPGSGQFPTFQWSRVKLLVFFKKTSSLSFCHNLCCRCINDP